MFERCEVILLSRRFLLFHGLYHTNQASGAPRQSLHLFPRMLAREPFTRITAPSVRHEYYAKLFARRCSRTMLLLYSGVLLCTQTCAI